MRTTQQMSITLPNEMAEFVREKVARGDYASDSEVLRDALRALREGAGPLKRGCAKKSFRPRGRSATSLGERCLPTNYALNSRSRGRSADELAGLICARGTDSVAVT